MDFETYLEIISERLHPRPYKERIPDPTDDVRLLLTSTYEGLIRSRYALAVTRWRPSMRGPEFLKSVRSTIAQKFRAIWTLRQVGLYLVICGRQADWRPYASELIADKTGLHAVIIQAVHFVDLNDGSDHRNQSHWGSISFGAVDSIASVLDSILVEFIDERRE
jgi:hypothetical protein